MHIAVALACVVAAGCGRLGFDLAPGGTDLPIDAAGDATAPPIALDPGFPIVGGVHHGTAGAFRTPTPDTVWDITDDASKAPNGHFHAIGRYRGVTTGPGTIKIGSATAGPYSLTSAVEVLPR